MLINVSPHYLYWKDKLQPIHEKHRPYFLAFAPSSMDIKAARKMVVDTFEHDERVVDIGLPEQYQSFLDDHVTRDVFKVYTNKSYMVPEVSDDIFRLGLYTAEHDVPYHERALIDLAAADDWVFDTKGKVHKMRVTAYDIEMTQFGEVREVPIDIIGYHQFEFSFRAQHDLDTEDFSFQFIDFPEEITGEVKQLVANNVEEEIDMLLKMCSIVQQSDIITGHNIIGFDNLQIVDRIQSILKNAASLSDDDAKCFRSFLETYARRDQSYHFGSPQTVAIFYPASFDTYQAARKFYTLNSYTLSSTADFLGVGIPDRLELEPEEMALDERTFRYNREDVTEQASIAMYLLQQALPLAFTTGMPFEVLLDSGATKMWDFMAMIRASKHKKIMPATCRAHGVAAQVGSLGKTKEEIAQSARSTASKEVLRVAKYGEEMPDWVEYPFLIYDQRSKGIAYHFPGGMTIKPDQDADSHFIPWFHVVVADVGAMYPTILKAVNAGADTVRLARADEKPDEWVWLKKVPEPFMQLDVQTREPTESFIDKGVMVGIKISPRSGLVNLAMTSILNVINKTKAEMKSASGEEQRRLAMMYQSLKGARNAGTHGILSAPRVSCRQFNLWGAALITTKGQQILADTLNILNNRGARVVYGDTDGIYVATSRSASVKLAEALNIEPPAKSWIIKPEEALKTIQYCNDKWRTELNYPDFELESEEHEAMIFVKHKNYLIFDVENDTVQMVTKGNNFKGSDKPDIARVVLADIMVDALRENVAWDSEEKMRRDIKTSIKKITAQKIANLDIESFDLDGFILVQSVQPPGHYKSNPNGSPSVYSQRAEALQELVGPITGRRKFKFVITKKPLPGILNPTKSGVKPIQYMYPVDLLQSRQQIDMEWYIDMIKNFVKGAFGLPNLDLKEQFGLDEWM